MPDDNTQELCVNIYNQRIIRVYSETIVGVWDDSEDVEKTIKEVAESKNFVPFHLIHED